MRLEYINPFIRYADMRGRVVAYGDFVMAYDHRAFIVIDGYLKIIMNDDIRVMSAEELAVLPPAFAYKLSPCDGESCRFIIIDFDLDMRMCRADARAPEIVSKFNEFFMYSECTSNAFPAFFERCDGISDIAEKMFSYYSEGNNMSRAVASALLKQIILIAAGSYMNNHIPSKVSEIFEYINTHYMDSLTNKMIGDRFSYHPNYINHLFCRYTGYTLRGYIIKRRLDAACSLLKLTDLTVSEICEKCGFESCSYFIKRFREEYGISPLKFRARSRMQII